MMKIEIQVKVGQQYGQLTVKRILTAKECGRTRTMADCECVCGKTVRVYCHLLRSGNTKGCGCQRFAVAHMTNPVDHYPKRVCAARLLKAFTQKRLGQAVFGEDAPGCRSRISRIETYPGVERSVIEKIAKVLGVDPEYFIRDEAAPPLQPDPEAEACT